MVNYCTVLPCMGARTQGAWVGKYRRTQEGSRLYSSFQTLETSTVSRQLFFWESLGSTFSHRPAGEKVRLTKHFVQFGIDLQKNSGLNSYSRLMAWIDALVFSL